MQFHKNSWDESDAVVCVWMYGPDEIGHICMYTARSCFDTTLFMVFRSFIAPVKNFSSEHFITIILS